VFSKVRFVVAIARILVDGYSLLNSWPELTAGCSPFSATARSALIQQLKQYADAKDLPLTIVFDGAQPHLSSEESDDTGFEVLFSRCGQTADQVIERVTHFLRPYGEVLVVTDDNAERDTVRSLGGVTSSCDNFIRDVHAAIAQQLRRIQEHNKNERKQFRRSFAQNIEMP
jgi:predicted RNA-binding protein with PIN domain